MTNRLIEPLIRQALESHLAALPDSLPTVWQNRRDEEGFNANAPHQKAFLLPANTVAKGLREKVELHSGIFQVNLCYPAGIGTYDVETHAAALKEHFKGRKLVADGVQVAIRGIPSIAAPSSLTPYVVPVTIRYESIN